jgi:hypothetical protein
MQEKQLLQMLDNSGFFSKTEQYFLISMRIKGMIEGQEAKDVYKNKHFFKAVQKLIEAGWVKKKVKLKNNGKSKTYYILTGDGYSFNSLLMRHPEYKAIWSSLPHKVGMKI